MNGLRVEVVGSPLLVASSRLLMVILPEVVVIGDLGFLHFRTLRMITFIRAGIVIIVAIITIVVMIPFLTLVIQAVIPSNIWE